MKGKDLDDLVAACAKLAGQRTKDKILCNSVYDKEWCYTYCSWGNVVPRWVL